MFDPAARQAINTIAVTLGVEPAALLAVAEVESGGQVSAPVDGRPMPLIRWEGHYFYRLTSGTAQALAIQQGLASPVAGGVPNPGSQQGRYDLLARAKLIDPDAALSSCSWGLGQVMGANWSWLGYPSVGALVDAACSGVGGQVEVMSRFVIKSGLVDDLRRRDFTAFARRYNGPSYKANAYDARMAAAYARYAGHAPASAPLAPAAAQAGAVPAAAPIVVAPAPAGLLRVGCDGPDVSDLQLRLRRAGYPLHVDGDFGPATRRAVITFQADHGLTADGVAGPHTRAALDALGGWRSRSLPRRLRRSRRPGRREGREPPVADLRVGEGRAAKRGRDGRPPAARPPRS